MSISAVFSTGSRFTWPTSSATVNNEWYGSPNQNNEWDIDPITNNEGDVNRITSNEWGVDPITNNEGGIYQITASEGGINSTTNERVVIPASFDKGVANPQETEGQGATKKKAKRKRKVMRRGGRGVYQGVGFNTGRIMKWKKLNGLL